MLGTTLAILWTDDFAKVLIGLTWLIAAVIVVAWTFRLGRFAKSPAQVGYAESLPQTIWGFWGKFFIGVVVEFRHFLALIVFLTFALTLFFGVFLLPITFAERVAMLQAVVASLGGLVGSIIGYYFGESAALKDGMAPSATGQTGPPATAPPTAPASQSGRPGTAGTGGANAPASAGAPPAGAAG